MNQQMIEADFYYLHHIPGVSGSSLLRLFHMNNLLCMLAESPPNEILWSAINTKVLHADFLISKRHFYISILFALEPMTETMDENSPTI